jgi:hypothetical protein
VEADAAIEASEGVVFEVIRNPTTVRKRRKAAPSAVVATAEEAATIEEEPVVEDIATPAPSADITPSGGVSGKRGRAA